MIDTFDIPNNDLKTQVFFNEPLSGLEWQIWNKPPNIKFISIFMLGGGAGGSGGIATAATTRFGGAGGGSSSITSALFPSYMLPDTLYIQVGKGGKGGLGTPSGSSANPSPGENGSLSYVSILPNSLTSNLVLSSGGSVATGGSNQTAGSGGSVFRTPQAVFSNGGIINSVAGVSGGASFTNAAGSSITISNIPISGGAGGGAATSTGGNFSGGSINEFSFLPRILGGFGTGSTINGNDGYNSKILKNNISNKNILLFTGGAGGGGFYTGTGGKGGNASYGSGGGGGGAGFNTSPFSGGTGGDGGDGIVIITSW
jgi:hypothetical protein